MSLLKVKFYVLDTPEERQGKKVVFWRVPVLNEESTRTDVTFFNEKFVNKFTKSRFVQVGNPGVRDDNFSLHDRSTVMICGKFDVDMEVVRDFAHGPKVTIDEALRSPKRRRISVSGIVSDVVVTKALPSTSSETQQRAQFNVCDVAGSPVKLPIKVWGKRAVEIAVSDGDEVNIENLEIGLFGSQKEATFTKSTKIQVTSVSVEGEQQGILRGFDIEGDTVTVEITTGTSAKMWTMSLELFDTLGSEEDIIHGLDTMKVTFTASKGQIVKISTSSETQQRAQFNVCDVAGSPVKLPIKVWGKQAVEIAVSDGDEVNIENLEIGMFGSQKEATFTKSTKIQVTSVSVEGEQQGILRGFDIEGDTVTVEITTGTSAKMWTMTLELFDTLGSEQDIIHGLDTMEVTFTASKGKIVKIKI
ncbi:PREDICTED: uncharacterized protein LOC106817671 [Priapulus caudatus]|uniref:Uncharacterized protein LOC106817671 n=1 Tax=Priapulus caudatus TaxID=37621 RepID=A0ABM1F071_PRICU|nr:PREDICTED: uncharacterized protein LOC106817671 [Priapulus caudatus]